jgi:hypothetical protein
MKMKCKSITEYTGQIVLVVSAYGRFPVGQIHLRQPLKPCKTWAK